MTKQITTDEILNSFGAGIDCSQVVLRHFASELGLDEATALKIASPFGGGMWRGDTCGAVVGALMVIGMKYGHCVSGDGDTKNVMLAKKKAFEDKFATLQGSCICSKILGYNLSIPAEMEEIGKQNLLATKCPKVVLDAIQALAEIL